MIVIVIVIVLSILAIILCLKFLIERRKKYEDINSLPGPPGVPILGNVFDLGASKTEMLKNLLGMSKKYGPIFKLWMGPTVALVVSGPEYIERILVTKPINTKGPLNRFASEWLGDALIVSSGKKWYKSRKIVAPFFNSLNIEKFIPTFNANANTLIKKLKEHNLEQPLDVSHQIISCTMDGICEAMISTTCDDYFKQTFAKILTIQMTTVMERTFSVLTRFDAIFKLTKKYKEQKKSAEESDLLMDKIVSERENQPEKLKTLLSILLDRRESDSQYTTKNVYNDINALVAAGAETTSITITFCIYQLSKHPEIQARVVTEIETILGGHNFGDVTSEDLQQMQYLECILKETMRLFTAVPLIERSTDEDIVIDGKRVPKNTPLFIFLLGSHMNETYFPEPQKFNPDRFLPENSSNMTPCSFVPFSAGPRNCLGSKFAMIEAKIILCKILRNFQIIEVENHKPILEILLVLNSVNGLPVILKPKN